MTVIKHFAALSTIQNTWKIAYHKKDGFFGNCR